MDIDGFSSPVAPRSPLPSSSAPTASLSVNGNSTPRRSHRTADALLDETDDTPNTNDEGERRARRPRRQINADVPVVKDAVGESVCDAFETLLKT
jgi:DNA replication licensing factor MCM6